MMTHFAVAMDSFKGSLSSVCAGEAVRRGILRACPQAQVVTVPIADGGEGTMEAYLAACGGRRVERTVTGPMGEPVHAAYAVLPDGTAVIETAQASGLTLVPEDGRDPCRATTRGTGELAADAIAHGARQLILGIGGSATNDGGAGFLRALGVRFLDADGAELPEGGAALTRLARIDLSGLRLEGCRIRVACDVDNPLCGARGASAVFGPQKGASRGDVEMLDRSLGHYAGIMARTIGDDLREEPGTGAAGGLGFALRAVCGAELVPGAQLLLETAHFDGLLEHAECVITGEGATDAQTAFGKAPVGVAHRARAHGLPAFILSGKLGEGYEAVYREGVTAAFSIAQGPCTLEYSLAHAGELLAAAAEGLVRTLNA